MLFRALLDFRHLHLSMRRALLQLGKVMALKTGVANALRDMEVFSARLLAPHRFH